MLVLGRTTIMRAWAPLLVSLLVACGKSGDDTTSHDDTDTTGSDTDTDIEQEGYPSTFVAGKYRMTSFVLLDQDVGADLDGDGTQDNNLPNLLNFVDSAVSGLDVAPDELNARIADNIANNVLVILMDCTHQDLDLEMDVLSGIVDPDTSAITVDPASLDANGDPASVLHGHFSSQTDMSVGPADINVPVVFQEGSAPLPVPIRDAVIAGTLDSSGSVGTLVGVAPANELVDQVIAPLIPDEGYDSNGDGTIDYTKDQLLATARSIANNENMADIDLGDGTRGISCAFSYEAGPASFPSPGGQ